MIRKFSDFRVAASGGAIAVAQAADPETICALADLQKRIEAEVFLCGDATKIREILDEVPLESDCTKIIHAPTHEDAAAAAVKLCFNGDAGVLMKGNLETKVLLRAVLNREHGLRLGDTLSHLAALEVPGHHKLLFITDGGMTPHPDFAQKKAILENAVGFLHKLGISCPKVAILAASESVSDKMPETVHAEGLARENREGRITGCIVEGPISFDLSVSADSAQKKGYASQIAGDVDILLTPDISSGNILAKALIYMARAKMAGCILGARAPIVLTSRGASAEERLLSLIMTTEAVK